MNNYQQAVDIELVSAQLGVAKETDDFHLARQKLRQLIEWHVDVATDPRVNGGYALVKVESNDESP